MKENIKRLFSQLENKTEFIECLSKEVGRKPATLRQSWFCDSGFWSVPEHYQERVVDILQKTIKNQNNEIRNRTI